jgi:hypothetical protein
MITLFASRKIQLLGQIHDINFQIDALMQQKINMTSVGMALGDGNITQEEMQNSNYYVANGLASAINLGNGLTQQSAMSGQPTQMITWSEVNPGTVQIHAYAQQQMTAQLAAQEKELDLKIKRLETTLGLKDKEYESVVKGEEKAIAQSAPKYVMG